MRDDVQLEDRPQAIRLKHQRPGRRPPCCCKAAARSAPIKEASTKAWSRRVIVPTGAPAFQSAPSTPPSLPANPPEERVEKLRQFWVLVTSPDPQWQFPTIPPAQSASLCHRRHIPMARVGNVAKSPLPSPAAGMR